MAVASIAVALVLCLACDRSSGSKAAPPPSPPFAALVDEYLDQFAERHPSIAAGNGIHTHDAMLDDFSAAAIAAEVEWLRAYRRRLDAIDPAALTPDARVDRRILQGIVDGWLLDLDTVRTWTRNPMIYASAISSGVHNLMTMESSPAEARATQAHAREDPAHLDRPEPFPATLLRPGRMGPLCRAARERRGLQARRSPLPHGPDE